ncbi:MAG TPA: P-II family nitrogen regulator [Clostridia bacterium]|nr:P-II family nitrogen regulator [Clostridia bacterium]
MDDKEQPLEFSLLYVIVDNGKGSKVLQIAKQSGITGGTVFLARGTAHSHFWEYLGLADSRKEVVFMAGKKHITQKAAQSLTKELKLDKPNHGIVFTMPLCNITGTHTLVCENLNLYEKAGGEDSVMYKIITVVVEKGRSEEVIDAAAEAGAKGGTIVNARGAGEYETEKVFLMDIEPEKEIVIIIVKTQAARAVIDSINQKLDLSEPGKGILFVQNVDEIHGVAE